jgi:Protein of unknown function (DUF3187)
MMSASARSSCLHASLLITAIIGATTVAKAEPLPTSDQNPLLAASGIPLPLPARAPTDGWRMSADLNWASTALSQRNAQELLVVDAETRELRLTLERPLTDRWSVNVQLPFRELSGGSLDSFIDNWHDVFGLPEGARPMQPHDRLRVHYSREGAIVIEEGRSQSGLADASAAIGYQLLSTPDSAARAAISIDLPMGEDHWFLSSDAVEVSALITAEHRLNDRWSLYGQGAVTWLDEGQLLPEQQRSLVWSGHAALGWQAARAVELVAQVNAHTRVFDDSDLDFFKEAVVLTLGGRIAITPTWSLNIGVSEDIAVEQSPDVVFVVGVTRARPR